VSARGSAADVDAAREVLLQYLEYARTGDYAAAVALYGGDAASLPEGWFDSDTLSVESFLSQACLQRILSCELGVRRVISSQAAAPDTMLFTLELSNPDGTRFEASRCCEEPALLDTAFVFRVRRMTAGYRVLDLPLYRP
jgi:hypothetical protein